MTTLRDAANVADQLETIASIGVAMPALKQVYYKQVL